VRDRRTWIGLLVAVVAAVLVYAQSTGVTPPDDLPRVEASALPQEAQHTLELIDAGGPFPYDQDGVVFHNYEGVLPSRPDGYYHEYTVETPGSDDRGARRIITGSPAQQPVEYYWTDDHYQSFERILR
jgi:ribonuclease T1